MELVIKEVVKVLREGGTILYPTDTIWGIGCDATNPDAVAKVYDIKKRDDSKSLLVLVETANRLNSYVDSIPEIAWDLVDLADKPLTIIYPKVKNLAKNLIASDGSIGIRVVKHELCERIIRAFGRPIVSTSANISGKQFPRSFFEIDDSILNSVNYIVPQEFDTTGITQPSGIIQLGSNGEVKVIRE